MIPARRVGKQACADRDGHRSSTLRRGVTGGGEQASATDVRCYDTGVVTEE